MDLEGWGFALGVLAVLFGSAAGLWCCVGAGWV
jgi:hypothetical protein